MKMKGKEKKGISLIVLVITIIIMIILAAAVILSLNSSNVVSKASEAKDKSEWSAAQDKRVMMMSEVLLDKDVSPEIVGNFEISKNEANSKVIDIKYLEGEREALIPSGFNYVTGTINTRVSNIRQ